MFKYRLPSRTGIFDKALQFELRKIRRQISESTSEGFRGLVARSMEAFRTFILSLGKPRFKFMGITIGNNTTSREYYNKTRKTIEQDMVVAEEDVSNLGYASVESFNVASILAKELETISAQAGSKAQDLALISRDDEGGALVAGDDFTTRNLISDTHPLTMPEAYVDTQQGMVTLARTTSEPVINPETVDIEVKPITAGIDNKSDSYKDNLGRFYEGRYYALAGQAEPEGGRWHLEELTSAPADNGFYYSYENKHSYDGGQSYKVAEYEYDGNEGTVNPVGAHVDEDGEIVIKNEIIIRDRGATEEEKKGVRKNMVDGAADTYWQCEFVFKPKTFGSTAATLQGRRWTSFNAKKGKTSGEKTEGPESYTPGTVTDLRGTFDEVAGDEDARLQVTPEDLRTAAKSFDNLDLEVTVTMVLPEPKEMNWLNLNPMNFGETAWLKIRNIEVAETRGDVYRQIPNFSGGRFQNILTEDVNHEVGSETVEHIMAPNQYSYRGTGIWTFPTRKVQAIRITIAQEVPTPVLYQKIRVQMHRIWEKLYKQTYDSSSRSNRANTTKRAEWTKVITLKYLQSVQILQGALSASEVAPVTDGSSEANRNTNDMSTDNFFDSTQGKFIDPGGIMKSLGLGGGHDRVSSSSSQITDTGFYMKGYWVETFYDLIGYRIGIRELAAFMNQYETSSEIVSVPFYSPVDLKKVTLRVDDDVTGDTSIEYSVSPDDGKNWYRLNPLDKPSIYGDDGFSVPKTISFNIPGNPGNEDKYVSTGAPVRKVLFKAEFKSNSAQDTPALRKYRLLMYPADSYRPQEFEA